MPYVQRADLNKAIAENLRQRRRQLLDVFTKGAVICTLLFALALLAMSGVGLEQQPPIGALLVGASMVVASLLFANLLNRHHSPHFAGLLVSLCFVLALIVTEVPESMANGRSMVLYVIPIFFSSLLSWTWTSFVIAALTSATVLIIGQQSGALVANLPVVPVFIAEATLAWLYARHQEHDLAERFRAEAESRERLAFQGQLLEALPLPTCVKSCAGCYLACNQSFADLFGMSQEQIAGKTVHDLVPKEVADLQCRIDAELLAHPGARIYESAVPDARGQIHDFAIHKATFSAADGSIGGLIAVMDDISEHKRAESVLRDSEEKYRILVEHANEAICVTQEGALRFVNHKAVALSGYTAEELTSRSFLDFLYAEDRDVILADQLKRARGERTAEVDIVRFIRKDGAIRWIELTGVAIAWMGAPAMLNFVSDITERRAAEEALRESEEKYRLLVENANETISVIQGNVLRFVNARATVLTGYSPEELLSRSPNEIVHPDDRALLVSNSQKRLSGGAAMDGYVVRVVRKDGAIRWAEIAGVPITWQGAPATLNFISDITERRAAEQSLRESEEKYRLLVENANEAILVTQDGALRFVNAEGETLSGYTAAELTAKPFIEFIHPDDRHMVMDHHAKRLRGESVPDTYGFRTIRKDGAIRWLELTGLRITWQGAPATLNFITDITERRAAEEALRESEANLRLLIEGAPDAIAVHVNGLFTYLNAAALRLFGARDARELIGQQAIRRVHPDYRAAIRERLRRLNAEGGAVPLLEQRVLRLDGTVVDVEATVSRYVFRRRDAVIVFLREITDRKRLEAQFLQAQKMETVGRLAGGVAHDFNNLLTAISGNATLALEALPLAPAARGYLEQLIKASSRAAELTRQLLAFSRQQVMAFQTISLNELVLDMDKLLRRLIGEDIELATVAAANLWAVRADPAQIGQVLVNLAVNARDAMPRGGRLTIETSNAYFSADEGREPPVGAPVSGAYVLLSVCDTGEGMSEEIRAHLFEPFFTTKEVGKGTGLGLATVYGIVQQHSGQIGVESAPGQGACFRVYLPRAAEDAPLRIEPDDTPEGAPRGSETVLVAEDEETLRAFVVRALRELGYNVLAAADGEQASQISRSYQGEIHLLLTDVVMPQLGGVQLAERLRPERPGMCVLYTSGYTVDGLAQRGSPALGADLLRKPFHYAALARKVREALD